MARSLAAVSAPVGYKEPKTAASFFDAVRAVWPKAKPMSVRLSATDWVGKAGITPEDSVEIARMLKTAGADMIDVSAGQTSIDAKPVYGRMFQTPLGGAGL